MVSRSSKYMSQLDLTQHTVATHVSANVGYIVRRLRSMDGVDRQACKELDVFCASAE